MEVFFETSDGREFEVELWYFDTVLEMKKKIEKYHKIPVCCQTLIFNGQIMKDDLDTEFYEVFLNCRIQLQIHDPPPPPPPQVPQPQPLHQPQPQPQRQRQRRQLQPQPLHQPQPLQHPQPQPQPLHQPQPKRKPQDDGRLNQQADHKRAAVVSSSKVRPGSTTLKRVISKPQPTARGNSAVLIIKVMGLRREFYIGLERNATVGKLKMEISNIEKIPITQLLLSFKGNELVEDNRQLVEYGVDPSTSTLSQSVNVQIIKPPPV